MAAIVASQFNTDTTVSEAYELVNVDLNDVTSYEFTPTNIKAITRVVITPTNTAAGASVPYATYTYGGATVTLTGAISSTYSLTVYGNVA